MGRVGRYKKIKAFDPFSKTGGFVDHDAGKDLNLAPRARDVDKAPRKVAELFSGGRKQDKAPLEKAAGGGKIYNMKSFPGESMKAFNRRVNVEGSKRLQQLSVDAGPKKPISEKRKKYLNEKRDRKKARASGDDSQFPMLDDDGSGGADSSGSNKHRTLRVGENRKAAAAAPEFKLNAGRGATLEEFPVDSVKFGDRVMEPPRSLPEPRKSMKQRQREALKDSRGGARPINEEELAAAASAARATEMRTARLKRDRDEAIAAYSQLKKRKREADS